MVKVKAYMLITGIDHYSLKTEFEAEGKWLDPSTLSFARDQWAPGVWAGSEGRAINVDDKPFTVLGIDMENRKLSVISY
jgi:hypothetical protein